MRIGLIILCMCIACVAVNGQYKGPRFPINDEWFWKYGSKGLQVGDKMPDVSLGKVLNNKTGKNTFSDFRGKLIILDFWSTGCTSCMERFPEMERLQKEFGNQIQIFIANPWETEKQIEERMSQSYLRQYHLPDLPSIVATRSYANTEAFYKDPPPLARYFPTQGVPHHVWINGKGVICLRGGAENTYAEKIKQMLEGKSISVLQNNATFPSLANDKSAMYYQQLGYMRHTPVAYGSFITPYTNEVTASYNTVRTVVDTVNNTRSTYFINQDLLTLYTKCLDKNMRKAVQTSPSKQLLFSFSSLNFIEFPPGTNILDYTSDPLVIQRPPSTEEITRSKYCYEQIVPMTVPEEERDQMMLDDLNHYFKVHLGITGAVQNRMVKYYQLIRTSGIDKIGDTNFSQFSAKIVDTNGKAVFDFSGYLGVLFNNLFKNKSKPFGSDLLHDAEGKPFMVVNGTGWKEDKKIVMELPMEELHTVADLRRLLQGYDLDLVERNEAFPKVVFTRSGENK